MRKLKPPPCEQSPGSSQGTWILVKTRDKENILRKDGGWRGVCTDQGTMGGLETEGQERRWVRLNTQSRMQRDLGVFEW